MYKTFAASEFWYLDQRNYAVQLKKAIQNINSAHTLAELGRDADAIMDINDTIWSSFDPEELRRTMSSLTHVLKLLKDAPVQETILGGISNFAYRRLAWTVENVNSIITVVKRALFFRFQQDLKILLAYTLKCMTIPEEYEWRTTYLNNRGYIFTLSSLGNVSLIKDLYSAWSGLNDEEKKNYQWIYWGEDDKARYPRINFETMELNPGDGKPMQSLFQDNLFTTCVFAKIQVFTKKYLKALEWEQYKSQLPTRLTVPNNKWVDGWEKIGWENDAY